MDTNNGLNLWYAQPASRWIEALPVGNGRLGAMVFGQPQEDIWQLNEDSVWYGGAQDRHPPDAYKHLSQLRDLLFNDRLQEAEHLAEKGFFTTSSSQRHYEPLGKILVRTDHAPGLISNYRRYLDINSSIHGVSYDFDAVTYNRTVFASAPHNVLVGRWEASKPGKISWDLRLSRDDGRNLSVDTIRALTANSLAMTAKTGGRGVSVSLVVTVRVEGGNTDIVGETLSVRNCNAVEVFLAAETTFRHNNPEKQCRETIEAAMKLSFLEMKKLHVEDYQALFHRVEFSICSAEQDMTTSSIRNLPTDEIMTRARKGHLVDPSLYALYFQFGRYLLISCSRPGYKALPANLQGIWNESMSPPWGSRFTININTQMNYWLAETCNLTECHEPYFDLLHRLSENGRITAQQMYGCGGWTAHHNTDIWADTCPQDCWMPSTLWPMGAAWLSTHIWESFQFTGDIKRLRNDFGVLRGAVEFFLDFLIDVDGYKVTSPSLSPENQYRLPNGQTGHLCIGPTMDTQILHSLFNGYLLAARTLRDADCGFQDKVQEYLNKLPPLQVGRHGQLQEWRHDYDEVEPGHRHVSHLWGLYPGDQIKSAELVQACRQTLRRRAEHGGGHTGWSRAWMIALWARLGDGTEAEEQLTELLRTSTHDTLLDDHPPFQIDGNFGATAAIAEMIIQSHNGHIALLPALPPSWSDGRISGLRARGGFEISMTWAHGSLAQARITSRQGSQCAVSYGEPIRVQQHGKVIPVESNPVGHISFSTEVNGSYEIVKS